MQNNIKEAVVSNTELRNNQIASKFLIETGT